MLPILLSATATNLTRVPHNSSVDGVTAQCTWGLLVFDCSVDNIPVINTLGFHADIAEQVQEINVYATL
jgi:hypothetical protein